MVGRRAGLAIVALAVLAAGCAEVKGQSDSGAPSGTAGTGQPPIDGAAGREGGAPPPPPVDFTMTRLGGYKLGAKLAAGAMSDPTMGTTRTCNTITGVVRDFKGALPAAGGQLEAGGHPDFEVFEGRGPTKELVAPDLPVGVDPMIDRKPVYASKCQRGAPVSSMCPFGAMTTTKENFDQWYRSIPGVNQTYLVSLLLAKGPNDVPTFWSEHFFPLDGYGWGNNGIGKDDTQKDVPHNFAFTTEVHTLIKYMGGEHFNFEGDDDVWVFINNKLAVDLGGLHYPEKGTIDLDAQAAGLGITRGSSYPMDLFHAERHSIDSNFHLEMNFTFEDCGYVVP